MLLHDKPKTDWDDLDVYDREAADIRRALEKIDLDQWVQDLKQLDPELFTKLKQKINKLQYTYLQCVFYYPNKNKYHI